MRTKYKHIYLDSQEKTFILHSLIELKNDLLRQGRYTDVLGELIYKVTNAKIKRLKVANN